MIRRATVTLAALFLAYVTGVNASWVSNAVYVSRVTGSPLMQVLDPLHRPWLSIVVQTVSTPTIDDENQNQEGI